MFELDFQQTARNPVDDILGVSAPEIEVTKSQKAKFGILVPHLP